MDAEKPSPIELLRIGSWIRGGRSTPENTVKRKFSKTEQSEIGDGNCIGEETRIKNGNLVLVTNSCGKVESSRKISEPIEALYEDSDLGREQAKPKEKTDYKC
ncbi:Hypothetical predicted protein [Marmota monax]|uniref:Uncharacterized protein n=1 Tax=Marmota monax TaxID=9995 RepID=A0A5E4CYS4_MARMO|nr:hypothetical protein GHT09_008064 [Marmota monax]VTJ86977.1 Hypothetical predicted protein [Marmota monax]